MNDLLKNETNIQRPDKLSDSFYWRAKDFPMPDLKEEESGPGKFAGDSEKQRSPRLNASEGNGPTVKGKEGKAFPADPNSKASEDESQTFAGDRDSRVSVNLISGQIQSSNATRLVPVPTDKQSDEVKANIRYGRKPADARENRL